MKNGEKVGKDCAEIIKGKSSKNVKRSEKILPRNKKLKKEE